MAPQASIQVRLPPRRCQRSCPKAPLPPLACKLQAARTTAEAQPNYTTLTTRWYRGTLMATNNKRAAPGKQPKGGAAQPAQPQPAPAQQTPNQSNKPSQSGGTGVNQGQPATSTIKKGV